ncbi:protein-tyrosine phosphatase-like protein [Dendryphion nanum]|uniref:Protein-tyrosine phosphatase-like protein n=1 Tax=Dendryphion nanum TaxID=256645 RepID=A0A9P9D4Z7_9PLEO|nr:protein-tyrosine phosphatase-like protein [Dendryphion nanum]
MSTLQANPLPSPPFYTIPNISNLRDCALLPGGLKTSTNATLRPGLLFRSAEVSKLDREGWTQLRNLGVAHIFDLRSKPEVERGWKGITGENSTAANADDVRPGWIRDLEAEGLERSWVPVFAEQDYSPEKIAERYILYMDEATKGFVDAYRGILENGGEAFGEILRYLIGVSPAGEDGNGEGKGGGRGALVHCTAGKDRTGMFFGILFSFLGFPVDRIADEYHLTEVGLAHIREEVVDRLVLSPAFRKYVEDHGAGLSEEELQEKGRQAARRMVGARKEAMVESLEMVGREWGSAEGYLRKVVGLGNGELEALRRNLLVVA